MSGGPGRRGKFWDALNRCVCEPGEDFGEVVAHRDFESAAAFNDGEDCCDARTGLFTPDVNPVGPTEGNGTHRILGDIGAQLQFWIIQKTCKPGPDRKRVAAGLAG